MAIGFIVLKEQALRDRPSFQHVVAHVTPRAQRDVGMSEPLNTAQVSRPSFREMFITIPCTRTRDLKTVPFAEALY